MKRGDCQSVPYAASKIPPEMSRRTGRRLPRPTLQSPSRRASAVDAPAAPAAPAAAPAVARAPLAPHFCRTRRCEWQPTLLDHLSLLASASVAVTQAALHAAAPLAPPPHPTPPCRRYGNFSARRAAGAAPSLAPRGKHLESPRGRLRSRHAWPCICCYRSFCLCCRRRCRQCSPHRM